MAGTHGHFHDLAGGGGGTVETACGLAGSGTAADPVTAAPAAGEEAWPWTNCAPADASTLKCDPTTGELWTPPEHNTDGQDFASQSPPVTFAAPGTYTRGSLFPGPFNFEPCRWIFYKVTIHVEWEVIWSDGAAFYLQTELLIDGTPDDEQRQGGNVTRDGVVVPTHADARVWTGSASTAGFVPPGGFADVEFACTLVIHPTSAGPITTSARRRASAIWSTVT